MNAGDLIAPELPRSRISKFPKRLRKAAFFEQLGPGLVTGAADDDPSGIATYSQAGAQFGFNMLWTMILTYPLMTAVQLVSAQIGRVTGCGLAKNIGEHQCRNCRYPHRLQDFGVKACPAQTRCAHWGVTK